jgi:S1-C subfamily serine protease
MTNVQGNQAGLALSNAIADAVERAGAVTALVNARRRRPHSGILFAADLVLTASHGVEREEEIQVTLPDGSQQAASLAGRDRGSDLAVLRLAQKVNIPFAQPGEEAARVGHLVAAVGRPSEDGVQASLGLVNAIGSGLRTMGGGVIERYLVTDAVPYPGFSGGPMVDLAGRVLGINTSGLVRGTSLAIPARTAWETAQVLAEHGHIKRGFLGIRSQEVELPGQVKAQVDQATGLLVVGIEPEGPAAQGGLMVGDILVAVEGQPVTNHDELISRLSGSVVGRAVEVRVLRGGQLQNVKVTVAERE